MLYNTDFDLKDPLVISGLAILGLILFMATLAGIGGGAAMLPITLLFFQFSPHAAISHTAVYEFVSTFSRVLYELFSTMGKPGKKRINFHIILVAGPVMFLGSFLGVIGNRASPESVILIGVTTILVFCVIMSFRKFFKKRKDEAQRKLKLSHPHKNTQNFNSESETEEEFNHFYDGGSAKSVLLSGEVNSYKDKSEYKPESLEESDWDEGSDDEYQKIEYFEKKAKQGIQKVN